jgi:hypothetical protein
MIAEQKRRLKALGILEKIKNQQKNEILESYSAGIVLRVELMETGKNLDNLIASTEIEIDQALKNPMFSPDIIGFKNDFLVKTCSMRERNTTEIGKLDENLKDLASSLLKADSQQKIVADKFRFQLDALRTDLLKLCEIK